MLRSCFFTALTLLVTAAVAQPQSGLPKPGPVLGASSPGGPSAAGKSPAGKPSPFKTITWEELVPKDWDPMKDFKGQDFGSLIDGDPRADAMLKKLREAWDAAPTNPTLVGQAVRIPGFVVPLEETKDGLKEFLLVPYFGACIHSPPPPANQIIHVLPKSPAKGVRSMDAVWITGTLATLRTDTYMGASGYRVDAVGVEPYVEKPTR